MRKKRVIIEVNANLEEELLEPIIIPWAQMTKTQKAAEKVRRQEAKKKAKKVERPTD